MNIILAIAGELESGKTTVAEYLRNELALKFGTSTHLFAPFAARLKRGACAMHGYDPELIDKDWYKREIDPILGIMRRSVLQKLGTEYGRNMLRDDIWINYVRIDIKEALRNYPVLVEIPDLRFANENDLIEEFRNDPNVLILKVKIINPHSTVDYSKAHPSELPLADELFDHVVVNDKTAGLKALYQRLNEIVAQTTA